MYRTIFELMGFVDTQQDHRGNALAPSWSKFALFGRFTVRFWAASTESQRVCRSDCTPREPSHHTDSWHFCSKEGRTGVQPFIVISLG